MSGALPVAAKVAERGLERLLGPDGTPFGSLPTRGKGVGLVAHARTVYQHIKAEQDVGHRGKGFLERHIDDVLLKRSNGKSVANSAGEEGELLIEDSSGGPGRSGHRGDRRRRRRSRSQGDDRAAGRELRPVFVPVVGRRGASVTRQGSSPPLGPRRSSQQSAPSVQQSPVSKPPSKRDSIHENDGASFSPIRGASSIKVIDVGNTGDNRSGSRVPVVRVQSPTPLEQAGSVRSPTPSKPGIQTRVQSPVLSPHEPAKPCPFIPSVLDMPSPVIPVAPPIPPPAVQSAIDPTRGALLASIQIGVKLRNSDERGEKDVRAASKDEARIDGVTGQTPVYEETPHSNDVEALEHAQAVEERERRQEEERFSRSRTPFVAPQPRPNLPMNFHDELTAKMGKINVYEGTHHQKARAESSVKLNVVKPRASNETWRTVYSEHAEENRMPDHQFRRVLEDQLSGKGTPQPPATATMNSVVPLRDVTPAPDVFGNLSAHIAGPNQQSSQAWDFSNVPKAGSD